MPAHHMPWSCRFRVSLLAGGFTATLLTFSGCATVDARTTAQVDVEQPAPTLASQVEVLRTKPPRPLSGWLKRPSIQAEQEMLSCPLYST